jgi:hypothetical protein
MENGAGRQAEAYFRAAHAAQMRGDLDEAVPLHRKSLASVPTADAHAFSAGRSRSAVTANGRDSGNSYNDIGSYLIALGRPEEAEPWLPESHRGAVLRAAALPARQPRPRLRDAGPGRPRHRRTVRRARPRPRSIGRRAASSTGCSVSSTDGIGGGRPGEWEPRGHLRPAAVCRRRPPRR